MYFILVKRKGAKKWEGAIPLDPKKINTLKKAKSEAKKRLKRNVNAKVISESTLKNILIKSKKRRVVKRKPTRKRITKKKKIIKRRRRR